MNKCIDDYVNERYNKWKQIAFNICKSENHLEDLLHDTLFRILEKDERKIILMIQKNEFEFYIIKALYRAWNSSRSSFYLTHRKFGMLRSDLIERFHEEDKTWYGARLDNETLDLAVSRLNWFEAQIFQLYIMEDFSYRQLEKETGIPSMYLCRTIDKAKINLKRMIIRK